MNDITFTRENHEYRVGGLKVPNVTRILESQESYEGIKPSVLEYASDRGTKVHQATEIYDEGDLDEDSLDEALWGYVAAWKLFRADTGVEIKAAEIIVYSARYGYAGMIDRLVNLNGEDGVLDIKCVAALSPVTALQTVAYAEALRTDRRQRLLNRYALQLRKDGTYHLKRYKDRGDLSAFLSALTLYNWRLRWTLK